MGERVRARERVKSKGVQEGDSHWERRAGKGMEFLIYPERRTERETAFVAANWMGACEGKMREFVEWKITGEGRE